MFFSKALSADEVQEVYENTRSSCSGSCYTDPVSHYQMENYPWDGTANEIGRVYDSGTSGNHGVAVSRGGTGLPTQTTSSGGKVCRAGVFTRVNNNDGNCLDLGDPGDGSLDPGTSHWTISAWVNWNGAAGNQIVYNKENLYELGLNGGYLQFAWQPHWAWDGGTTYPLTANTWSYVTTIFDGNQQIMYRDGAQVFSRIQAGSIGSNTNPFRIGARGTGTPTVFFNGMIDEMKIYDRALSQNELLADYSESRLCATTSVLISSTSPLPDATMGASYSKTIEAYGGSTPYFWQIISTVPPISGLGIDFNTGELSHSGVASCAGDYVVTIRVTDVDSKVDQKPFDLKISDGSLVILPASQTFTVNDFTFSQAFTCSGPHVGNYTWTITWLLGNDPGCFANISGVTGESVTLTKTGALTNALGEGIYYFNMTVEDATCATNKLTYGPYGVAISGNGALAPP